MKIEVFYDVSRYWRWRMVGRNGKIICTSGESYDNKGNAKRAANRMRQLTNYDVPVVVLP